jgi:hypothetical protein
MYIANIEAAFQNIADGARGCSICGRALRDKVSKLLAVGPDCARQWRIPHSRGAAPKRLELRAQILGTTKTLSAAGRSPVNSRNDQRDQKESRQ